MDGFDLVKNLAERERELSGRLEEARRSAGERVKAAETEARRILAETEAEIGWLDEQSRTLAAEEGRKLAREAQERALKETEEIRKGAESRAARAVRFVIEEVLP